MADDTEQLVLSISADVRQMQRAIDRLVKDSTRATGTIQKQFNGLGKGTDTALQSRINTMVGAVRQGEREWKGALANQGEELDRLRLKFNPLAREIRRYRTTISEIRRAHGLGAISANEMAAAISRERQASLASIAAIKGRQNAVNSLNVTMRASSFQTANVAAQLNDIGVQLASGTSPFLIAIQQGTQLNQVLGTQGVRGALSTLTGAFASIVNPVSLATIAIIGLGGAAVQYFTSVISDGARSEETIKEQRDLIRQVAGEWGDALPALKAYADELDRLEKSENLEEATAAAVAEAWEPARKAVVRFRDELGKTPFVTERIGNAFQDLNDKVQNGTALAEDAREVQRLLAQSSIPGIKTLADEFGRLAGEIDKASSRAAQFSTEGAAAQDPFRVFRAADQQSLANLEKAEEAARRFVSEQERLNGLTADQLALEQEIARVREEAADAGAVLTAQAAERLARDRLAARQSRREGGGDAPATEFDRLAASIQRSTQALQIEAETYGLSREAAAAYRVEQELINAAKESDIDLSPRQMEAIAGIAQSYAATEEALRRYNDSQREAQALGEDVIGTLESGFVSVVSGAQSLNDALDGIIGRLLEIAASQAFQFLLSGGLGGGGGGLVGGILGSIFHDGGVVGKTNAPARSVSPSAFAAAPRLHNGLMPDEFPAILQRGETVLPRDFGLGDLVGGLAQKFSMPASKPAAPAQSRPVTITVPMGEGPFSRREVQSLIARINQVLSDGSKLGGLST